jgi:hypothetical protein
MSKQIGPVLVAVLLASTTPALAHSPIMGIGGVLGGILHALLIPEHGLSLLALGLALGQQELSPRRAGILIYAVALTCGIVAAVFAVGETFAADALLTATGILGLLVVTMWTPTYLVWTLAAIAGLTIALDSRPEVVSNPEVVLMLLGSGFGAGVSLGAGGGFLDHRDRDLGTFPSDRHSNHGRMRCLWLISLSRNGCCSAGVACARRAACAASAQLGGLGPSSAPILLSAHSSDHLTMCPTGLNTSCSIVVLAGGAEIAVSKQITSDADLTGR